MCSYWCITPSEIVLIHIVREQIFRSEPVIDFVSKSIYQAECRLQITSLRRISFLQWFHMGPLSVQKGPDAWNTDHSASQDLVSVKKLSTVNSTVRVLQLEGPSRAPLWCLNSPKSTSLVLIHPLIDCLPWQENVTLQDNLLNKEHFISSKNLLSCFSHFPWS